MLCETEVLAGAVSRPLSPAAVARARRECREGGRLAATDGGRRLPASACEAPLARHAAEAGLLLTAAGAHWAVTAPRAAAPGDALRLWLAPDLLLALRVPFLTPRNVTECCRYVCHVCGRVFAEPNPLKAHLLLRCRDRRDLPWARLAARWRPPSPPSPPAEAQWGRAAEAAAAAWARATGARGGGHRCVYCGRRYSRAYGLKIHVRTHTGYKPLRCGTCARAFGDPSNLNKHLRLHRKGGETNDKTQRGVISLFP